MNVVTNEQREQWREEAGFGVCSDVRREFGRDYRILALLDALAEAERKRLDMERDRNHAVVRAESAEVEVTRLRAVVERVEALASDLASHGLRFDLNPTMPATDHAFAYLPYIKRMDDRAREIGADLRAALTPADTEEER